MNSVLFFQYAATFEGWTTIIRFTNLRTTDEEAVEQLKSELDSYFHVGIELHDLSTIKENEYMMRKIHRYVPELEEFLNIPDNEYKPAIDINYKSYINYS